MAAVAQGRPDARGEHSGRRPRTARARGLRAHDVSAERAQRDVHPRSDLDRPGVLLRRARPASAPGCGSSATATSSGRRRSRRTAASGWGSGSSSSLVVGDELRRRVHGRRPDEHARVVPDRVRDLQHVHADGSTRVNVAVFGVFLTLEITEILLAIGYLRGRARWHRSWWLHAGGWVGIAHRGRRVVHLRRGRRERHGGQDGRFRSARPVEVLTRPARAGHARSGRRPARGDR